MTTLNFILALLDSITSETTLKILTRTSVKLLKKDSSGNANQLGEVYKVAEHVVVVGKSYQEAVNEQRTVESKEADFVAEGRVWGVNSGIFVMRGEEQYLNTILVSSKTIRYENEDGEVATDSVYRFMSKSKPSSRQGVDELVKVRTFKLSSILEAEVV